MIIANAGNDVEICKGESTTLTASGGSSYQWSNGAKTKSITVNPTSTKTYSVIVSDGTSSDIDEVKVTVNYIVADAGSNKTIEFGQSIVLTASGGDTYFWSTGAVTKSIEVSPNGSKIYSVTVHKNGCEDTDNVQVSVNQKIVENSSPAKADAGEDVTICVGESITLSANGGKSYLWSTGDNNKNVNVSPKRTTTYTVKATRGGITDTDTIIVTVENCKNSLAEDQLFKNLIIYPNPSTGILNINASSNSFEINLVLMTLNGSIVYYDKMNSKQGGITKQIDLSRFAKGVYFVRLYNSNQNIIKKIMLI